MNPRHRAPYNVLFKYEREGKTYEELSIDYDGIGTDWMLNSSNEQLLGWL